MFLAIADDTAIRRTATNRVPGLPMPAFAQSAGGILTDKQIDAIVSGIRSWAKPTSSSAADISLPVNAPAQAIHPMVPSCMRRTARRAMAPMAEEAVRPAPL